MKIRITNSESEMEIYNGDAETYLEMNDNDTELEYALNSLDNSKMSKIEFEGLTIKKEIELIYD